MVKTKELVELEASLRPIEKGNLACPGCQLNLAFKHSLAAASPRSPQFAFSRYLARNRMCAPNLLLQLDNSE